ncbi:hypothetical protein PENTCL1PPCAC_17417, partial [Pristionchus entomophagus]
SFRMEEPPRYNEVCLDDRINQLKPCPSDLKCAICCSIYVSPVMLSCGHSFCSHCADGWLRKKHTCPTCRRDSGAHPIKNIALGQIVEEHNRIIAEDGPVPCDPQVSDDDDDMKNVSGSSATPAETFVRGIEERRSTRRKTSSKYSERRLHSMGDCSPIGRPFDSPVFVRSNTVRFAPSIERTPLHVMAARRRLDDPAYVYTGLTPQESVAPVPSRFERKMRGRTRTNQYYSPSRRSEQSTSFPQSPGPVDMKRGGVIRRSLGLLRKSVRLLRKESSKSQQEESIDEKEEENDKNLDNDKYIGDRQAVRRVSIRKSIIRRLRGWKNTKNGGTAIASVGDAAAGGEEAGPRLVAAARVLVIDSTDNVELAAFLRSLSDVSSDSLPHIRVLSSEERRELPLLREEYEGLTLVSILYTDASDPNNLVVFDIYEGRREMSGEVEHCALLLKCCHAVLLFCASDPASALRANSDFRYVQTDRKGIPMWTIHAIEPMEISCTRGRNGSTWSGGGGPVQSRSLSLAHANRHSTSELSSKLLPTKQKYLQLSDPPREEFIRAIQELLSELKAVAVPIQ